MALLGLGAEPAAAKIAPYETPGFVLSDAGSYSAPALADLDADGDSDLVAGEQLGTFRYFENTGSAIWPRFPERTGVANPLVGHDAGTRSTPALGDLDGDGDLDLVTGAIGGQLRTFRNVGTARVPEFARIVGAPNPLAGTDVGQSAAPGAGDLDGDGAADLVTGNLDGTFAVHLVPEPTHGAMLGAGIALLRWFERLRQRRSSRE